MKTRIYAAPAVKGLNYHSSINGSREGRSQRALMFSVLIKQPCLGRNLFYNASFDALDFKIFRKNLPP